MDKKKRRRPARDRVLKLFRVSRGTQLTQARCRSAASLSTLRRMVADGELMRVRRRGCVFYALPAERPQAKPPRMVVMEAEAREPMVGEPGGRVHALARLLSQRPMTPGERALEFATQSRRLF